MFLALVKMQGISVIFFICLYSLHVLSANKEIKKISCSATEQ